MTIHAVADCTAAAVPTIAEASLQPGIERDLRTAVLFGRQVEIVGHVHQIVSPGADERADAVLRKRAIVRPVVPPERGPHPIVDLLGGDMDCSENGIIAYGQGSAE